MASNRVRFDAIALLVVVTLILSGVLPVNAALTGFGSSVVIVIAGLLVIGEMLDRTGIARAVGDWILRHGGKGEVRLLVFIMTSAGILGSVMSSTAIVAIFIPIVKRIASETGIAASRILIPMAYAALISGMMTLIASSPNVVVSGELATAGYEHLGFFSFTLIGVAVLGVAVVYVVTFARHLLRSDTAASGRRKRTIVELWIRYRLEEVVDAFEITPASPLAWKNYGDTGLDVNESVHLLYLVRRDRSGRETPIVVTAGMELKPGDLLLLSGEGELPETYAAEMKLRRIPDFLRRVQRWMWEMGLAEVLIHPDSETVGRPIAECDFQTRYGLQPVGLRKGGDSVKEFEHSKLAAGDSMLVVGPWKMIEALMDNNHDFVIVEIPPERGDVVAAYDKAPIALAILGAMVAATVFDIVPLVVAVLLAAMAAVASGCLGAKQAYRSIRWSSLVLVAGMLPLADALQVTGGTTIIVDVLLDFFGSASPSTMLTVIFALTALLGMVLSNTAAAVLVAPIAIAAAEAMGVSPYPFGVAVLIAAAASFSTPISTPVVTLVVEPGQYTFGDFVKAGVPLLVLTWLVTVLLTPILFPY